MTPNEETKMSTAEAVQTDAAASMEPKMTAAERKAAKDAERERRQRIADDVAAGYGFVHTEEIPELLELLGFDRAQPDDFPYCAKAAPTTGREHEAYVKSQTGIRKVSIEKKGIYSSDGGPVGMHRWQLTKEDLRRH